MGYLTDMISGVLLETYLKVLKGIILAIFLKIHQKLQTDANEYVLGNKQVC